MENPPGADRRASEIVLAGCLDNAEDNPSALSSPKDPLRILKTHWIKPGDVPWAWRRA
jgi:hypothetical protein